MMNHAGPVATSMANFFVRMGEEIIGRQHIVEAWAFMRKAVSLNPDDVPAKDALVKACIQLAFKLVEEGRLVEAGNAFRQALSVNAGSWEAKVNLSTILYGRGLGFMDRGQPLRAESALHEALTLNPGFSDALTLLQKAVAAAPDLALAQEHGSAEEEVLLRRRLAQSPHDAAIKQELARNLYRQANHWLWTDVDNVEAEGALRAALLLWPDYAEAANMLSIALYQLAAPLFNQHRFGEVEGLLCESVMLNPQFDHALKLLENNFNRRYRAMVFDEHRFTPRAKALFAALAVKDVVGYPCVRKGVTEDGGYVMVDRGLENAVAYSFGIGRNVSWDLEMARAGGQIFQYDHTIPGLPDHHPSFHWSKLGIAAKSDAANNLTSIDDQVRLNGHEGRHDLIMKIDIEGWEWEAFAEMDDAVLCQFSQIVGEFHWFLSIVDQPYYDKIMRALNKLNKYFQLVHIHANNQARLGVIGGITVYDALELAYVRKSDFEFAPSTRSFPTELDAPCCPDSPDFFMGKAYG